MARLCFLLCLVICLLSFLSFSSALPSSTLSNRLRSRRNQLGVLSAIESTNKKRNQPAVGVLSAIESTNKKRFDIGSLLPSISSCIEHPLSCVESAGSTIINVGTSAYTNLVSDVQSTWSNIKNGLSDIENTLQTDLANFVKFVDAELQSEIVNGLVDVIRDVLNKIGTTLVNKIIPLQTEAAVQLKAQEAPILRELKVVLANAKQKMLGFFSSSSTASDLESQATSSSASEETATVQRTALEAAETDVEKELEYVIEDTLSASSIKRIVGNSCAMGVVFAVVDIGLLSLGYPITVYKDRAQLKQASTVSFIADFISYYEYALLSTLKNVAGDFLSILVDAISTEITVDIIAAIDVGTLGLGALASAALAFIIDFAISFIINMVLSVIISLSFPPFYNLFWNANLENDVSQIATLLAPSAVALCSGKPVPTPPQIYTVTGIKNVFGNYLAVVNGQVSMTQTLTASSSWLVTNLGNNQYTFQAVAANYQYLTIAIFPSIPGLSPTLTPGTTFMLLGSTLCSSGCLSTSFEFGVSNYLYEMLTFQVPPLPKQIALLSYFNTYLTFNFLAVSGNTNTLNYQAIWNVVSLGNNQYKFVNENGNYLTAQLDGTIQANGQSVVGETFTVEAGSTLGLIAIKSGFNLYLTQPNANQVLINSPSVGPNQSWSIVLPPN